MNLTLPDWTKDYYPDKLIPLTLYDFQLNVYNDLLKRLKGGPFLKKIVTDMLAKKANTLEPDGRKMFMYIGHDSTIVTLLDVMHVWNNQMPHYNIMTMIELHESEDGWNVQVKVIIFNVIKKNVCKFAKFIFIILILFCRYS